MPDLRWFGFVAMCCLWASGSSLSAEDAAGRRRQQSKEFHLRAQERTGLLVPMYVYPSDADRHPAYNRLIDLKRRYETVPVWVILNPASGPDEQVDGNYTRAVERLRGAGCVVLGYVDTAYGKRPAADVHKEVDRWLKLYPGVHGIFFDQMVYEDAEAGAKYQAGLSRYAHDAGCWPTVANPGASAPGRYFAAGAADVIVVHEGNAWPTEERLKSDFPGGHADHPPFTRGVLVYSQPALNRDALRMVRKYARWVYVTEGLHPPGDGKTINPWAGLSKHLDEICDRLSER